MSNAVAEELTDTIDELKSIRSQVEDLETEYDLALDTYLRPITISVKELKAAIIAQKALIEATQ